MLHAMIDLETSSLRPDAAILAIGAVGFEPEAPEHEELTTFYVNVDLNASLAAGLHFDGETFYWWLDQERAARERLMPNRQKLSVALKKLGAWLKREKLTHVWSHGLTFDLPILETAYGRCPGLPLPWSYKRARDTRTIFDLCPRPDEVWPERGDQDAPLHDALADAQRQAHAVWAAYGQLGLRRSE